MEEYPLFLYLFDKDGRYSKPITIKNDADLKLEMNTSIKDHIKQGLEVRITDTLDMCVFHAQDGKIVFPKM